ncbi:MAG: hypothetical protein GXP63_01620 [DPANN group archaeon]|nr:hypothetical protein [DPANN group archaeon]
MVDRERILSIMRMKGPILPNAIAKEIGLDILMSGAVLAEMASNKLVRISSIKIGSSPLYYLPGQESQLMRFAEKLNEKEFRTYEHLKGQGVLRDSAVTPLERVALRAIKDFAVPLNVTTSSGSERFWKFFTLNKEEATEKIKTVLGVGQKSRPTKTPPRRKEPARREDAKEQKRPHQIRRPPSSAKASPEGQQTLPPAEEMLARIRGDAFLERVYAFFRQNNIEIRELRINRKNADADMVITMPSAVGKLMYTCKAKNKKHINDGDLSSAFVNASTAKLPLLFLTTGQLTKKAQEMLGKEFRGISLKRI